MVYGDEVVMFKHVLQRDALEYHTWSFQGYQGILDHQRAQDCGWTALEGHQNSYSCQLQTNKTNMPLHWAFFGVHFKVSTQSQTHCIFTRTVQ